MKIVYIVMRKELRDALRDRRTLFIALLSALIGVPLLLALLSVIVAQAETQEEKRTVLALGMEHAPQLENFILRQAYQIRPAPPDYLARARNKELDLPVLLVPADFSAQRALGRRASVEIVYDSANRTAELAVGPLRRLLAGYAQEEVLTSLSMRGIAADLLQPLEVHEHFLQTRSERKLSFTAILPMLILMVIVVGGMVAAIDTTAGERERGSLEPLMMNPLSGWQLAIGKWGAVSLVASALLLLVIASFFPSQYLLQNDGLRAEFQFGGKDALLFLLILLPLTASMAALQIAVALEAATYKEAQVRNQMVTMFIPFVSLLPILFPGREPAWFQWTPVLAQNQLMNQVLRGEACSAAALGGAAVMCAVLGIACLWYTARRLRRVALQ